MKKQIMILLGLLLMAALLSGCMAAQAAETGEFSQVYSEYALHSQDSTVWIYSRNKTEFVEAGLDAVTDNLIARYRYEEHLIELELEPLDEHQCQLIDQREMPLYQMRGSTATPENEVEVLVHGGSLHAYYAVWLRSETMSEAEIINNIALFVDIQGSPNGYVRITKRGPADAEDLMQDGRNGFVRKLTTGDVLIEANGDTLDVFLSPRFDASVTGNWSLQRYANGYWRDIGIRGTDFDPAGFFLDLSLSDGYYQLVIDTDDARNGCDIIHRFGVGSLSNLRAGDLPQGQYIHPIDGLWLELEEDAVSLDEPLNYRVRNISLENIRFEHAVSHTFEVLLDGQWHRLPWYTGWWNSVGLISTPESGEVPIYTATTYQDGSGHGGLCYLFDLCPGKYRITVSGTLRASSKLDLGVGWNRDHSLAAEFTITE